MKDADSSFGFLLYDKIYEKMDNVSRIDDQMLENDVDIPSTVNRINKFFDGVRLSNNIMEQKVWCQIQIGCNKDPHELKEMTSFDLREKEIYMNIKQTQVAHSDNHWFCHGLYQGVDVQYHTFRAREYVKKHKKDHLQFALVRRRIQDGRKATEVNDVIKLGIYVEGKVDQKGEINSILKRYFESQEFKDIYKIKVMLIPKYAFRVISNTNTKVLKLINQHRQVMSNLTQYDFPYASVSNANLTISDFGSKTLRELILDLKSPSGMLPFLAVENRTHFGKYDGGIDITYVKGHDKEAGHMCNNLGFYLKKQYGDKVLKFFDADTQNLILETKTDTNGRPISIDDTNLEESNKAFELMGFDMSIIPETIQPSPSTILPKIQFDQDSVSTFASANKGTSLFGDSSFSDASSLQSFSTTDFDSVASALSTQSSMKSEITTLTNSVSKITKHLKQLQRQSKLDRDEQDARIEESKQDFIKSNDKTQQLLQALLNQNLNPSADGEQVGVA